MAWLGWVSGIIAVLLIGLVLGIALVLWVDRSSGPRLW
jgi:high-affinity Fe2+/Pb2+ permease